MDTNSTNSANTEQFNKRGFVYVWTLDKPSFSAIKTSRQDLEFRGWKKHGLSPVNEAFALVMTKDSDESTQCFLRTAEFERLDLALTADDFTVESPLLTIGLVIKSGFLSYKRGVDAINSLEQARQHQGKMANLWSLVPSESRAIVWLDTETGIRYSAVWVYDTYTNKSQVIIDAPSHMSDYRNRVFSLSPVVWEKVGCVLPAIQ